MGYWLYEHIYRSSFNFLAPLVSCLLIDEDQCGTGEYQRVSALLLNWTCLVYYIYVNRNLNVQYELPICIRPCVECGHSEYIFGIYMKNLSYNEDEHTDDETYDKTAISFQNIWAHNSSAISVQTAQSTVQTAQSGSEKVVSPTNGGPMGIEDNIGTNQKKKYYTG